MCSLLKQILVERELPLGLQLSRLLEMSIVTGKLAGLTEAELAKAAQDILMMFVVTSHYLVYLTISPGGTKSSAKHYTLWLFS